jgi:hypothetical protein
MSKYFEKATERKIGEYFQSLPADVLLAIAQDETDAVRHAKQALANIGMGKDGEWLGHDDAKKYWDNVIFRNGKEIT